VGSLQARKELFEALDLIPPAYTFEAASAAVQAAPRSVPAAGPTPKPFEGKDVQTAGGRQGVAGSAALQRNGPTTSTVAISSTAADVAAAASGPTAAGWHATPALQGVAAVAPRTQGTPALLQGERQRQ
jgi:hypothetical protein